MARPRSPAPLFFADHVFGQGVSTISTSQLWNKSPPLPAPAREAGLDCPSYYVALADLSLVEATPCPAFRLLLLIAGENWLKAFPSNTVFWVDNAIGRRLCRLYEALLSVSPTAVATGRPEQMRIEGILLRLIA